MVPTRTAVSVKLQLKLSPPTSIDMTHKKLRHQARVFLQRETRAWVLLRGAPLLALGAHLARNLGVGLIGISLDDLDLGKDCSEGAHLLKVNTDVLVDTKMPAWLSFSQFPKQSV